MADKLITQARLKPYEYQNRVVEWMKTHPKSYIACDMGTGKSLMALKWIENILPKCGGVLVIAPLRTISTTWPDEIAKWTPNLSYTILHGAKKLENLHQKVDVYLINFEAIPWLFEALAQYHKSTGKVPFRGLVIDEGSMVKSWQTKRFKILKLLIKLFTKYTTILSGTPAPNSLLDLWAQYYLLDQGKRLEKYITHYKQHYFYQADQRGYIWKLNQGGKETIYSKIEDITFRLDAKDYLQLPEMIKNVIKVPLSKKLRAQYKLLEKEFFLALDEDEVLAVFNAASLSMKLRQFIQGAVYIDDERNYKVLHEEKLKVLKSLVEEAGGQGILCCIQFRFELEIIRKVFPGCPYIAGGVSAQKATSLINKWNRKELPLLLCHPASISHGVNLQSGGHMILWYGLPWSLEQYLQLNKRLHRNGQKHAVIIHHLVVEKSVDEKVIAALNSKLRTQSELLDYLRGRRL